MFCSFRFCKTRWVDDRAVADCAIERLVKCYSDPFVRAKLHFFSFVAGIFESYLMRFQTDTPMVSFMFDELSAVFKKLVGLIFKKDAIGNA